MRALLRLRRRLPLLLTARSSSSSEPHEIPTVYSFLQPSIFAPHPRPQSPPPPPLPGHDTALQKDAPRRRRGRARVPGRVLPRALAPRRCRARLPPRRRRGAQHRLGLKRAFSAAVFLLEKSPHAAPALGALFSTLAAAGSTAPALALARAMLRCGRRLLALSVWGAVGHPLIEITRDDAGAFAAFLNVFDEACKLVEEKVPAVAAAMRPLLPAMLSLVVAVVGLVRWLMLRGSTMSAVEVSPYLENFGSLAFAWRGVSNRVDELNTLLDALGFSKKGFFKNLISG
nr:unnamed protein product [Digitaria exilis]